MRQRGLDGVADRGAAAPGPQLRDRRLASTAWSVVGDCSSVGRRANSIWPTSTEAGHAGDELAGRRLRRAQPRGRDVGGRHRAGDVIGEHDRRAVDGHRDRPLGTRGGHDQQRAIAAQERDHRQRAGASRAAAGRPTRSGPGGRTPPAACSRRRCWRRYQTTSSGIATSATRTERPDEAHGCTEGGAARVISVCSSVEPWLIWIGTWSPAGRPLIAAAMSLALLIGSAVDGDDHVSGVQAGLVAGAAQGHGLDHRGPRRQRLDLHAEPADRPRLGGRSSGSDSPRGRGVVGCGVVGSGRSGSAAAGSAGVVGSGGSGRGWSSRGLGGRVGLTRIGGAGPGLRDRRLRAGRPSLGS